MPRNGGGKKTTKSQKADLEDLQRVGEAAREVLNQIPFGIILCGRSAEVLTANDAARQILDRHDGLRLIRQRLCAENEAETAKLRAAIETVKHLVGVESQPPATVFINRKSGQRRYDLLISALRSGSSNGDATVAIFVCDATGETKACEALLQKLFDFTPAEARLARSLLKGNSVADSSQIIGIRPNTARNQLKSMFAKTNVSRQGELIRILMQSPAILIQG